MSEETEPSVLGSLPQSRPQRRSEKRAARPAPREGASPEPEKLRQPQSSSCAASLPEGAELVGTAVRAAVELAEIGLTLGARALRLAVSRLPKP
jgi:hypothetical protein